MTTYSKGCTDVQMVKTIQAHLGIVIDGVFGPKTEQAVISFQMKAHLVASGIVDSKTLAVMGILDTDLRSQLILKPQVDLIIERHFLPPGEYIKDTVPIKNDYLFLHHTAGWEDPFKTIDIWARDDRGAIATEFVLGGQRFTDGSTTYDGRIAQAFPEGCQGWHVAATGVNAYYMNCHSVGIEICNFGQLNNDFKNYVNIVAHQSQRVTLKEPYRGYSNWHCYSDAQLKSLSKLILYIASRDNIDIRKGVVDWIKNEGVTQAFSFKADANDGKIKGLLFHDNVRKDKVDLFPQQELVDMLLSL